MKPGLPSPAQNKGTFSSMQTATDSSGRSVVVFIFTMISTSGRSRSALTLWIQSRCASGNIFKTSLMGISVTPSIPAPAPRSRFLGSRRSTPKGLSVLRLISLMASLSSSTVKPLPPRTPSPPASETATTRSTGAPVSSPMSVGPMPALRMGYSMPNMSHSLVLRVLLRMVLPPGSAWVRNMGWQVAFWYPYSV